MNITAWRIYKRKFAASAFTGEGARLYGGRLNSRGVAVVYTAQSISLASLEMLVHLNSSEILGAYAIRSVSFDDSLARIMELATMPRNWRRSPPPASARRIGDRWIAEGKSAVLQVPSALTPSESNYLLNPNHPDFAKIKFGPERIHRFDRRLKDE